MTFFKRINDKNHPKREIYTSVYFEMRYRKFDKEYNLCFMAPDMEDAKIKAKSILRNYGGDKILSIKSLPSDNLASGITWNR